MEEKTTQTLTEHLADRLAQIVLPHNSDRHARERLRMHLIDFAAEIRRSAIEP